jgi:hypothetical protein
MKFLPLKDWEMMMNPLNEKEIQISETTIHRIGWGILLLLLSFTLIGIFVSPRDQYGKPILLLPDVKAMQDYRQSAQQWLMVLSDIDGQMNQLLSTEASGDLFTQSKAGQQMLQQTMDLVQEVDQMEVNLFMWGFHEQMSDVVLMYLESARLTMQWISAPEDETHQQAINTLAQARQNRKTLENYKWLISP